MNTNNGELWFGAGIDPAGINADAEKIKATFKGLGDSATAEGAKIDKAFNSGSNTATKTRFAEGVSQIPVSAKLALQDQKELIKSIEADVKHLEAVYANAAAGSQKLAASKDLRGARKALAEEQGTLLGMQKQQITANDAEKASQGGIISSLSKWALGLVTVTAAMKVGKAIIDSTDASAHLFEQVIGAAGAATNYFFKSIASGDWSNFFSGMAKAAQGAVDYVDAMERVNNLTNQDKILTAGYDKKIADLREATYDRSKENRLTRIKNLGEIVVANEEKYSNLIETANAKSTATLNLASTATGGKVAADQIKEFVSTYRSLESMLDAGKEYNKAQSEYDALGKQIQNNPLSSKLYLPKYDAAIAKINELGEAGKTAGKYVANIELIPEKMRGQVSTDLAQIVQLTAQQEQGNKFDKRQLSTARKEINDEKLADAKKGIEERSALEQKTLDEQKKRYEIYFNWVRAYGTEVADKNFQGLLKQGKTFDEYLTNQITAYESNSGKLTASQVKDLQTLKNTFAELKSAQPADISEILSRPSKQVVLTNPLKLANVTEMLKYEYQVFSKTTDDLIALGTKELRAYMERIKTKIALLKAEGKSVGDLEGAYKRASMIISDRGKADLSKGLISAGNILQTIAKNAGQADEALGKMVQTAADIAGNLGNAIDAFSIDKLTGAAKDPTGGLIAIANIASTVVDGLDKQFGYQASIAKEEQKRIDYNRQISVLISGITVELDRQLDIINKLPKGAQGLAVVAAIKAAIEAAKKGLADYQFTLANAPAHSNPPKFDIGFLRIMTQAKDDFDALQKGFAAGLISQEDYNNAVAFLNQVTDSQKQLDAYQQQWNELITGSTQDDFVNSRVDGFVAGKTAASDFAKSFADLMKKAVLSAIRLMADEKVKQFYEDLAKAGEDGFTQKEIDDFKIRWLAIGQDMAARAKAIEEVTGIIITGQEGQQASAGAFQSMSQDTGNALEGRFTAMQMSMVNIEDVLKSANISHKEISLNMGITAEKITELRQIALESYEALFDIRKNTNRLEAIQTGIEGIKANTDRL